MLRQLKTGIILLLLCVSTMAHAKGDVTIAILDFTPKGVPKIVSSAITDIMRSEFVNIGNFSVVERTQIKAILDEQGLQMTGCTDSACAVQMGKILSASRIVIGEVNSIRGKIIITVRYVNVGNGKSLFSATGTAAGIDVVDGTAKQVARDLAERIVSGDKEVINPKTPRGFYARSLVPGWGQFYAGNRGRGYFFGSAFAVTGLATAASVFIYYNAKNDYDSMGVNTSPDESRDKRAAYEDAALYVNISAGILAAVYIASWVDSIFFSRKDLDHFYDEKEPGETAFIFNTDYTGGELQDFRFCMGVGYRF